MRNPLRSPLAALIVWSASGFLSATHAQVFNADVADSLEYQQTGPTTVTPFNGGVNAFFYARAFAPSATSTAVR